MLEIDRQEALTAVVVADHGFQALFDELSAAWTRLRSMRAAILGVSKIAMLPGPLLAKAQNEEPLDPDYLQPGPSGLERVKVDWQLVNEWRDAVTRLKENASMELPNSGRGG